MIQDYEYVYIGEQWIDGERKTQVVHDDRPGAEEDIAIMAGFDGRSGLAWELSGEGTTEVEKGRKKLIVTERRVFTGSPANDAEYERATE